MSREYSAEEVRALADKEFTHKQFQKLVNAALKLYGWTYIHLRPAFTGVNGKKGSKWEGKPMIVTPYDGHDGFPDSVAMKERIGIAWELKVGKDKPTPGQLQWLRLFKLMGFDTRVCYPRDIEAMLQFLRDTR